MLCRTKKIICCIYGSLLQLPRAFFTNGHQHVDEWTAKAEDKELSSRWLHWGPISATMIGLSTTIVHVAWWEITTIGGCLDLMLFLTWNYLVLRYLNDTSLLSGGYIKFGWHPEDARYWKLLRYCYRCMCFKVPRSHHCSRCNRCVLLMDHHCPWINNCVGQRNQFYFIRFLFWAVVGCVHASIILTSCLYQVVTILIYTSKPESSSHLYEPPNMPITSVTLFIFAVFAVGLAYGVIVAVGVLLCLQLYNVYLDITGIESHINENGKFVQHNRHVSTVNGEGLIRSSK